jgi:hypothetical protein
LWAKPTLAEQVLAMAVKARCNKESIMLDLSELSKYRENNRIEAKKLLAVYQRVFGKPIPHLPIRKEAASYLALTKWMIDRSSHWGLPIQRNW